MPTDTPTPTLHSKLAQIMFEAERIPKNGTAPAVMGGYRFVQVGDAADFIRKALAEKSISMLPSNVEVLDKTEHETKNGGSMTTVDLRVTWTLTDGITGETATIVSYGAGADGGDKYSGKATTSAMKYALLAGFLLSTGEDTELGDTSGRGRRAEAAPAETETLLGREAKTGRIAKGDGRTNDLTAHMGPEGHQIGFKLTLRGDTNIAQCLVTEGLGEALFKATGGEPETLVGVKAKVSGLLYEVRQTGRTSFYRMRVTGIETDEWTLPAAGGEDRLDAAEREATNAAAALVGVGPDASPEAESVPLFDEQPPDDVVLVGQR